MVTEEAAPVSSKPASVPSGLRAGLVIGGKYELERKLGTGAMGEVWAARHLTLDEHVAIKLVMRDVAHNDGTTAESRFLLEARVASALARKTRHIVSVTDHGEDGPLGYLVMELLDGESLDARLARKGPLPLAKVVPIVAQIARGLSVAHAEGIVHRDLKPSNVFVTKDERGHAIVKILDFGIAKLRASMRKMPVAPCVIEGTDAHATMHGFLLGTPAYMSPEQARGKTNVDHRSDVWALAVIAYHLLTGEYPFEGKNFEDLLGRIGRVRHVPARKRRPELPEIVDDFFTRAFAPSLEARFQTASAFTNAFEQLEPLASQRSPSLPPPVVVPLNATDDESIYAEGVLRKGRIKKIIAGGTLVSVVLLGTAALVSLYLERDPAPAAKLTAGANIVGAPVTLSGHDDIPPPPPESLPIRAEDLPAAAPPPPSAPMEAKPSSVGASISFPPPAQTAVATPAPPVDPKKPVDKSEIF